VEGRGAAARRGLDTEKRYSAVCWLYLAALRASAIIAFIHRPKAPFSAQERKRS
jgi:hypothetical protein